MNFRELVNLGLAEKEAKVYLANLELGKSSVQDIARKAGVNRATTYVIIESLMKKGLASSSHEGKKQFFYAENPEKLVLLFRTQEQEIKRKRTYLEKILPELKALDFSKQEKPTVRYFEGKEGLMAISEELYINNNDKTADMVYSYDLLKEIFSSEDLNSMSLRRQNKKIKVRSIINDSLDQRKNNSQRVVLPSKEYPITCDIAFFGNKVRIVTQKKPFSGLVIENKEITKTLRVIFNLAWEHARALVKRKKARGSNLKP